MKSKIYKIKKSHFFGFFALTLVCIHISSAAEAPKRIALLPFKINAEKDLSFLRDGIYDMLTSRLTVPGKVQVISRSDAENIFETITGSVDEATAREIGTKTGLKYVYTGNVPGENGENTFCHNCGENIIDRWGFYIKKNLIENGQCMNCGVKIHGVFS